MAAHVKDSDGSDLFRPQAASEFSPTTVVDGRAVAVHLITGRRRRCRGDRQSQCDYQTSKFLHFISPVQTKLDLEIGMFGIGSFAATRRRYPGLAAALS